jgi:hypothetical protein
MARIANTLLHLIKFTILYFRTLDSDKTPSEVAMGKVALQCARSSAFIASFRGRVKGDLGLERSEAVLLDVDESRKQGQAVVTVVQSQSASKSITKVDLAAGINAAHARAAKTVEELLGMLGCTSDEAQRLSDPSRGLTRKRWTLRIPTITFAIVEQSSRNHHHSSALAETSAMVYHMTMLSSGVTEFRTPRKNAESRVDSPYTNVDSPYTNVDSPYTNAEQPNQPVHTHV